VIVTVEGAPEVVEFETVSEKVSVAGPVGAVNVGFTAEALDNVTVGPAVCVHA
jgi:hypothetical protein